MAFIAIADGSRLILTAMAEDMESNLNTPNEGEDEKEHESESETEMIKRFNGLIQFHFDVKQLSLCFKLITKTVINYFNLDFSSVSQASAWVFENHEA